MKRGRRKNVVSSFTIIKGAMIDETYAVFAAWDLAQSKPQNLDRLRAENVIGASSANWLRDAAWAFSRRFEPNGRDRALVLLAQHGCNLETWKPLMLWHMTRDEFLVRDFLLHWLFPAYDAGTFRIHANDLISFLRSIGVRGAKMGRAWSEQTLKRVAAGLLKLAVDFGPHPSPAERHELAVLGRRAWSIMRRKDMSNETSHAFVIPAVFPLVTGDLEARRQELWEREHLDEAELAKIRAEIDNLCDRLYGLDAADQAAIAAGFGASVFAPDRAECGELDEDSGNEESTTDLGTSDLTSRSPGMYPEKEEPTNRPDIVVDDEGHADDLAARVLAVADRVHIDVPESLRAWLAREFFPLHIKMYSKSRRKAPIYWQLATTSASYSVWLYIHAFSKDTLFRVQNDYVAPKLAHEDRRLEVLTAELRDMATAARRKELAGQAAFVEELRGVLDEVKRVAPLWNPNLDDGVIINFAPLWRLVPQNKSWQKELKATWEALCEGKYDWAHLAMHLWPERVVPKCAKDRSLAIAHGLEDVFWVEGSDGKWTARKTPTRSVDELVRERTSPAVKSALKSLLEAPGAAGAAKKTKKGKASA